jgi:hypothetical protein
MMFLVVALVVTVAAQGTWPPATEPVLDRKITMTGTGQYAQAGANLTSTAMYYQADSAKSLRVDLGMLNVSLRVKYGLNVESVIFKGTEKQCTQFVNHGLKEVSCIRTVPDDEGDSFTYDKQLAAFGKATMQFMGTYTFSASPFGQTNRKVLGFGGKIFEGTRGDMCSVVWVNAKDNMYSGQLDIFDDRSSTVWMDVQKPTAPAASVFAIPASCPQSQAQEAAPPTPPTALRVTGTTPVLSLDKTMTGSGSYTDVRGGNKDVVNWYQDSAKKMLLISVGDTSTEKWQQVNLYNATGRYLMVLEQGNPKCFFRYSCSFACFLSAPNNTLAPEHCLLCLFPQ